MMESIDRRNANEGVADWRVLNVGSGPPSNDNLHAGFRGRHWCEIRLDIDPVLKPDVVGSATDLSSFADGALEAVWSSHNIEHLYAHEVPKALTEFRRVLRPDGFVLVTCPDLVQVAKALIELGPDVTVYTSPAGPITPLDMVFGHQRAVEAGNGYMAHRTGFTQTTLGEALLRAGFAEVRVLSGPYYDLWGLALCRADDLRLARAALAGTQQENLLLSGSDVVVS